MCLSLCWDIREMGENHRIRGHISDQGPSSPIAQFGRGASSRKSLCGSKLLPFNNDGGHCVLGDLQCSRHVLVPFTRSVSKHNPVPELYRQFLQPHGLVFAQRCTVYCGTLYRQVCAFPNHAQSSCRNISMMDGNRMHLCSILSLIAKGLNSYVNKVFVFICNTFAKNSKPVFAFLLWGVVDFYEENS